MNSTAQWSILWNAALFPPQEMLPPDSLFCTSSCDTTPTTNSDHLFGFTPCMPLLNQENSGSISQERHMAEIQSTDTCEDFSTLWMAEEFSSFI